MTIPTLISFIVYFVTLLAIGLYFCRPDDSIEGYLLGKRRMGAWVTALSTQASDMSGWLLMGLPGVIYAGGIANAWIAIGLFIGTVLNWKLVSARLRLYTQKTNSITLPCFFEQRFGDPTGLLRMISAVVILVFFTIYASSGLVACGKLFESTFGISYGTGVWIGGAITILYTLMGGYLAVCWTDVFQGSLMVLALVGMITGTIVLVVWKQIGLSEHMYEIVPGFVANSIAILLINRVVHQRNAFVLQQFDEVGAELQRAKASAAGAVPGTLYERTSRSQGE